MLEMDSIYVISMNLYNSWKEGVTAHFSEEHTEGARSQGTCPAQLEKKSTRVCLNPQPVARALLTGCLSLVASHISLPFFAFFFLHSCYHTCYSRIYSCVLLFSVCLPTECNPLGTERQFLTLSFPVQSSGEKSLGYIPACIPAKLL